MFRTVIFVAGISQPDFVVFQFLMALTFQLSLALTRRLPDRNSSGIPEMWCTSKRKYTPPSVVGKSSS